MTLYILVGIVAVVTGAVLSRQWTLASFRKLAKEAGVEGAINEALQRRIAAEKRRADARRQRWNLAQLREWYKRRARSSD